ncbi:MAG TPA: ORF6N domain-containing protein [Opitutaceae bacterium]|nr:ORF6N domain-containing protein [Opitutaceae bacterium]
MDVFGGWARFIKVELWLAHACLPAPAKLATFSFPCPWLMSRPKIEHALPPIQTIRGQRVVLDSDLAALYGVTTKVFNQTIRRNAARFPVDFLFQLTEEEFANLKSPSVTSSSEGNRVLRSQVVTLNMDRRGQHRKYLPLVFTEHGAIMAATILRSPRAVAMSVYVVRAFVRMREELLTNAVILKRLALIDKKLLEHDVVLRDVVERLLPLLNPPAEEPPRPRIGFHQGNR